MITFVTSIKNINIPLIENVIQELITELLIQVHIQSIL